MNGVRYLVERYITMNEFNPDEKWRGPFTALRASVNDT